MKQIYEKLSGLEKKAGYVFKDKALLFYAMVHSSYTNEHRMERSANNERLEFLGDAVLELSSSDYLYREYPDKPEGEMTKFRASVVCEPTLAGCARAIGLGEYLFLGKGEDAEGGRSRDSILSDAFEALIGAIYLDGGMDEAKAFINRFILSDLEDKQLFYDSKTNLQEMIQGKLKKDFNYMLLEESGPEHDKVFEVAVCIESEIIGRGKGRTKKAAEQQAAYVALRMLRDKGVH